MSAAVDGGDLLVATFPKNAREEVRISLSQYGGHNLANLRVWYQADDEQMKPGRHGLAIRLEKLAELRDALDRLDVEARKRGLLR